jgi:hypothetical protein
MSMQGSVMDTSAGNGRTSEMRIRSGSDADAAAAAAVVQRVLHEHGLPFEPRGLDAVLDARRLVLVPSFA